MIMRLQVTRLMERQSTTLPQKNKPSQIAESTFGTENPEPPVTQTVVVVVVGIGALRKLEEAKDVKSWNSPFSDYSS